MRKFLIMTVTLAIGSSVFGNEFPNCTAQNGQPVGFYLTHSTEGGPAYSTIMNGQPIIVFNEALMSLYAHSRQSRMFIYLHECGHQALGHTMEQSRSHRHTNTEELAADCYASEKMREMGFTSQDFDTLVQDLKLLRKDPDHPGHVKRIENASACFLN